MLKSFTLLLGMMLLLSFGSYANASAFDITDFSLTSDGTMVKKLSPGELDDLMKRIILYEGPTRDINDNNFIAAQASGDVAYVQFSELEKNEVAKSRNTLVLSLALHQSFYENFHPIILYICNLLNYIRGQK
ncbi:hypothetical protein ABD76_18245 [Paenibacillus dendritiformis]|uniref:hypothetical protein n=1 Tax=Paenibacillus dendritiformis TaxID=130049 RepID=UPI001A7EE863|nr:hypothetical protein [Paenibacillus dendritiformis]MBG9794337.1 hypothetical protein [Paenibacillus dendritiformis]